MDRKLTESQEIERLIRMGEAARYSLGHDVTALRQRFDFPERIRSSLKSHPTGWLLGSLASGFAASLMFRRRPAVEKIKQGGMTVTLLGLALTAVRPLARIWLTDQVKNYLASRQGLDPVIRPRSQSPNPR